MKLEFAEWIRQVFFPVQAFEGAGNSGLYCRERTNASLRFGGVVTRAFANLWGIVVCWHKARRTAAALHACSDRMLQDIGIDRSEITSIVFYGGDSRRRGPMDRD